MSMPTISVIIPAWRAADTIGRAIASVLAQTSPATEIIVIDDGSPDDTAAAIVPFGSSVRYIRQDNQGASAARNTGIRGATSDYVAFLDADDEWLPDHLATFRRVLVNHPDLGLLASRYESVEAGRESRVLGPSREWRDRVLRLDAIAAWDLAMSVWTGTVLIRRELVAEDGFRRDLRTAEDRDLWIRVLLRTTAWIDSGVHARQHITPGSLSLSGIDADCANMLRVVQLHAAGVPMRITQAREASVFRRWAGVHLSAGDRRGARQPAWERVRREPFTLQGWWILIRAWTLG